MEATAAGEEKPPRPTGDGASSQSSVPVAEQPAPLPAGIDVDPSCAAAAEEEDEQVERFYALLANIRALRGMYRAGSSAGAGADRGGSGSAGRARKRAREAEPPWRPVFTMEDFEEVVSEAGRAGKKKESRDGVRRPAGNGTGAVADDEEGEVVETRGSPRRSA
ncbi:NRR repressor homolog 1-like [Phragmites australis]|uniref:NRR repressor homolog 1-like n=1 Tax=Phragmites australis TaxID=29695 RepID=UPI002D790F76|nr:NRR repressor homolog 1-like [Phragmites australis]